MNRNTEEEIGVFRIGVVTGEPQVVSKASFVQSFMQTKLMGHSDSTTTRPQLEEVYQGMPVSVVRQGRNTIFTRWVSTLKHFIQG